MSVYVWTSVSTSDSVCVCVGGGKYQSDGSVVSTANDIGLYTKHNAHSCTSCNVTVSKCN